MTHDEITRHGTNIIDLFEKYTKDNKLSIFEFMVVFVEVVKLMRQIAEEEMSKHDS